MQPFLPEAQTAAQDDQRKQTNPIVDNRENSAMITE